MELETKKIVKKRSLITECFARILLKKRARLLVCATKKSGEAANMLLYELPGVFCVTLRFGSDKVRLLKEADQFRIMKKSEKSENSLSVIFKDRAVLAEVCLQKVPLQKAFSEDRVIAKGKIKYFAVFARINAEADKTAQKNNVFEQ